MARFQSSNTAFSNGLHSTKGLDFAETVSKPDCDVMDIDINGESIQFSWDIDESLLNNFKKTMECTSSDIKVHGFTDYTWIWTLKKHENAVKLYLSLKSLPSQIGSLKINCTISCKGSFSYVQRHDGIRLTIKNALYDRLAKEQIKNREENLCCEIIDTFDITQFTNENIHFLQFKCNMIVLIKYDLFGGIISGIDKPIYVSKSKSNNIIVYGYINYIHNFDHNQIQSFPVSIYDLIYYFYLTLLNIKQQEAEFIWKFDNKCDVNMFMNCVKDDSITSRKFELYNCIFYLELTPNGWNVWNEGDCLLWLAVDSLPKKASSIKVLFRVHCDAIGFSADREEMLNDAANIGHYGYSLSQKEGEHMRLKQFKDLKCFEFKIFVKVLKIFDETEKDKSRYDFLKSFLSSMSKYKPVEKYKSTYPDKAIYTEPSILYNIIVYGYIHNCQCFVSIPALIYDLIYEYYLMLLNFKEKECKLIWKFDNKYDINLFMNCAKNDIIASRKFDVFGCVFYIELTPNGWGTNWSEGDCLIWLALDSLPKNVKKVKICLRIICDSIGFLSEITEVLSEAENSGLYAYSVTQDKDMYMKIDSFRELEQFEFKIFVKVMKLWDESTQMEALPNILSETFCAQELLYENKPIFMAPSKLNNIIVYGYMHNIKNFNLDEIQLIHCSNEIYDLIYEYYLMILNVNGEQSELLWKFNNKKDIDLFMNCCKGDIITSRQFEINGNVFYLELTPNGWGYWNKGDCVIWLAVHSLPQNVRKIKVLYRVVCDAIGYKKEKIETLCHPMDGVYSTTPEDQIDEAIKIDTYKELSQFEFKIFVKVISKFDKSSES